MVKQMHDHGSPDVGDLVKFFWGLAEVRGGLVEIYGPSRRPQAIVELTPEVSGGFTDEPTTVSLPLDEVTRAQPAA